jgi:hypothetical protein
MSKADSPVTTESVYGGEYLVKGEAREGEDQLLNRTRFFLVQVLKNGRLGFVCSIHGVPLSEQMKFFPYRDVNYFRGDCIEQYQCQAN